MVSGFQVQVLGFPGRYRRKPEEVDRIHRIALCTISSMFMYMMLRLSMYTWVYTRLPEYLYLWPTVVYGTASTTILVWRLYYPRPWTGFQHVLYPWAGWSLGYVSEQDGSFWHRLRRRRILGWSGWGGGGCGDRMFSSPMYGIVRTYGYYAIIFTGTGTYMSTITERISIAEEAESLPVMYEV